MNNIILCCLAGAVNNIFACTGCEYENGKDDDARRLDNKSVVTSGNIVIAQPRDFEVRGYTIKILSTVSVVTVDMIMEVFPNLLSVKRTEPRYNQDDGKFYVTESYWYNSFCLKNIEKEIEVTDSERRAEIA